MTIYEPIKQIDGTFKLKDDDLSELKKKYSSERIYTVLLQLYELTRVSKVVKISGELPPCPICGSMNFLRTGNCHVCATCGESQGCS